MKRLVYQGTIFVPIVCRQCSLLEVNLLMVRIKWVCCTICHGYESEHSPCFRYFGEAAMPTWCIKLVCRLVTSVCMDGLLRKVVKVHQSSLFHSFVVVAGGYYIQYKAQLPWYSYLHSERTFKIHVTALPSMVIQYCYSYTIKALRQIQTQFLINIYIFISMSFLHYYP